MGDSGQGPANERAGDLQRPSNIATLVQEAAATPDLRIDITDLRGASVDSAQVGDELVLRIAMPVGTPYAAHPRDCFASAPGSTIRRVELSDERGCATLPELFARFEQAPDGPMARFEAFRFPGSFQVVYQCTVEFCVGECEEVIVLFFFHFCSHYSAC